MYLALMFFVLLGVGDPAPRPWLGAVLSTHDAELTVAQATYAHGIRLDQVVADSPAARAGLRVGDVMVAFEGADFDCPAGELRSRVAAVLAERQVGDVLQLKVVRDSIAYDARLQENPVDAPNSWEAITEMLEQNPPGARLELSAQRHRALVTVEVTLGARPLERDQAKVLPPNQEIFTEPVAPHPAGLLAEALVQAYQLTDDYRDQRSRLAALVERGDYFRLERVAYVLREPFTLPTVARQLSAVPSSIPKMFTHAAGWLDLDVTAPSTPKLRGGLTAQEHAQQIEQLMAAAFALYEEALADLAEEERDFIARQVTETGQAFIDDIMVLRDPDPERLARVQRLVTLAPKVKTNKLIEAAVLLAQLLEPDYRAHLAHDLKTAAPGIFLTHPTAQGNIIFAGAGSTWFREPAAVIVDLGGDDVYMQPTQRPFALVLDLAGDDAYEATFEFAQGAGLLGVSLLYDAQGNDSYLARRWSQGCGVFGVGLLFDAEGDDVYRGADFSQGAGFFGVGLLVDRAGTDRYEAPRFAQALGMPGGWGALIEGGGDDHYFCKGRDLGAYGTAGVFAGWGQGCGVGFRSLASGGVALLLDEGGNDHYEAGNFSQGGGYYFGLGALIDRGGDDRYLGSRYGQAFAAHQALGYLQDDGGDDVYRLRRGVGQSCSWDETVTVLYDRGGNDEYSGGDFALAASAHNGLALLLDESGRDRYHGLADTVRARPNDYHGGKCFSLLLDLGGAEDVYEAAGVNDTIRHHPEHSLLVDMPGDLQDALAHFRTWLIPAEVPAPDAP